MREWINSSQVRLAPLELMWPCNRAHLPAEVVTFGIGKIAADLNWRIRQRISASFAASAGSRLMECTIAVLSQSDAAGSSETFKTC